MSRCLMRVMDLVKGSPSCSLVRKWCSSGLRLHGRLNMNWAIWSLRLLSDWTAACGEKTKSFTAPTSSHHLSHAERLVGLPVHENSLGRSRCDPSSANEILVLDNKGEHMRTNPLARHRNPHLLNYVIWFFPGTAAIIMPFYVLLQLMAVTTLFCTTLSRWVCAKGVFFLWCQTWWENCLFNAKSRFTAGTRVLFQSITSLKRIWCVRVSCLWVCACVWVSLWCKKLSFTVLRRGGGGKRSVGFRGLISSNTLVVSAWMKLCCNPTTMFSLQGGVHCMLMNNNLR